MKINQKDIWIILLFVFIQCMVQCEIPDVVQNWENLPNPKQYSMNFYAAYTHHYVNEIEKDLDEISGKVTKNIIRSYIPEDPLFIQWEGKLSFTDDNLNEEERKIQDKRKLKINVIKISEEDIITTYTHYMNSTNLFSLYHTSKLARLTSSKSTPFLAEWPFWIPTHPAMQKVNFFIANKREDLNFIGQSQNGDDIIKFEKPVHDYIATLIFDNNGFLSEYDENEKYWRRNFKLKYMQTEQGIVLTECVVKRYYKESHMPDTPMETFEFYADLDSISFQNVNTFSQFPDVPNGYKFIDHINGIYIDENNVEKELLTGIIN